MFLYFYSTKSIYVFTLKRQAIVKSIDKAHKDLLPELKKVQQEILKFNDICMS